MMVIFVSQCEKKALKRTRRVLDAFADRIGDNTWQTIITEEGLQAVKKLLRKTASKSTAVSCRWIRSRSRSDLLWVVGRKNAFDYRGVVAVNRTRRNVLHSEWENNWQYASSIQIIATLAALLHDMGKSTVGFQNKLIERQQYGDAYRHEWISLKLFEAMVAGCQTDAEWLERLQHLDNWLAAHDLHAALKQAARDEADIASMPPLAQWVAWLIATHHRLPPYKKVFYNSKEKEIFKRRQTSIKHTLAKYYDTYFCAFEHWVKNPHTLKEAPAAFSANFWQCEQLVVHSQLWQKQLKRWAKKAQTDVTLEQLSQTSQASNTCVSDMFLLYLSRLSLMVGDHNYSSLPDKDKRCVSGDAGLTSLAANTDRNTGQTKQTLDEHLLGVGAFTAQFARKLPVIASALPRLAEHQPLEKQTVNARFAWQNKAYTVAKSLQKSSAEHGFFGVNMASTGCGKTIGNARIMYALADPKKGARFTIALGLRVLTLQTGQSFRRDLQLNDAQLAILVGGQANKKLFELNQQNLQNLDEAADVEKFYSDTLGSESSEDLLDEMVDSDIDYQDYAELGLGTVIENDKARDLLFSPVVTCTVDHIIQASECKRGGKYIAPMLRLLSSDLILDEPDDFDQADLPALSRLVHLAGLFGARVLLSSATLTPDMVTGLFNAYLAGRKRYNQSQQKKPPQVVCAWFDENHKSITTADCENDQAFIQSHLKFTQKRADFLASQPVRRKAEILPLSLSYETEQAARFYAELGQVILAGALRLHDAHHVIDPTSQKQVSIGLVRIANINNITQIAMQLFKQASVPDDVQVHLCCYHAKQLLVLRNALETKLDRILRRNKDQPNKLFKHAEIQTALRLSAAKKHLFIVLATPVAEVGRDHDYDWAIVEPSSMRSIIQLAGRVWRHRPDKVAGSANMLILQYNIRYLKNKNSGSPVFINPGFEMKGFQPNSYDVAELIPAEALGQIDARPRIRHDNAHTTKAIRTLGELEHRVMLHVLNNDKLNYVNAYWDEHATASRAHTHLQQISEFRAGTPQEDWILIPKTENDGFDAYYAEDIYAHKLAHAVPQAPYIQPLTYDFVHRQISPWLNTSLTEALQQIKETVEQNEQIAEKSLQAFAVRFATASLEKNKNGWGFHAFLGFVKY